MKLSRIISVFENQLEDFEEGKVLRVTAGTSWSGEESQESFTNEWNKGIEIVINFDTAKQEDFKRLTIEDVDDNDILECDIEKYDEYRNIDDLELVVKWFGNGIDEMGYVEIEVDYK